MSDEPRRFKPGDRIACYSDSLTHVDGRTYRIHWENGEAVATEVPETPASRAFADYMRGLVESLALPPPAEVAEPVRTDAEGGEDKEPAK